MRTVRRFALCLGAAALWAGCAGTPQTITIPNSQGLRGAVAADHHLGSLAGVEMLRLGGNAVDAAVAAAFTQSVVRPQSTGLGGGGFMLIHLAGDEFTPSRSIVVNYRETAPASVDPAYYVDLDIADASRIGPHAVGIPGTVAGLLHALEHYGTLDRSTVLRPAIRAAEEGFAVDVHYVEAARSIHRRIEANPEWRQRIGEERLDWFIRRFLMEGNPRVGRILRQPELAQTLRRIAHEGASAFYIGAVAEAIAEASPQVTLEDLARYQVETTEPLIGERFGRRFLTMPPPSSGGIAMLQVLGILEEHAESLASMRHESADYAHLLTEALKHAFADRAEWLGDPRFVDVPIERLLDEAYLAELAARFDPTRTFAPDHYGSREHQRDSSSSGNVIAGGGTSHLSAVDSSGNAVALTDTVNLSFGSLVALPDHGFILNNEMDDFLTVPGQRNAFGLEQSDRNLPAPGKRPLSSMSPTIVLRSDEAVEIVAGASGGPRIISGTLQAMLNVILFDMSAAEAVAAPRLHHQWAPDRLAVERRWRNEGALKALEALGHRLERRDDVGIVQLIRRTADGDDPASDPRKGGRAARQ